LVRQVGFLRHTPSKLTVVPGCRLDGQGVLPPRDRYLELAPRYWRITRARLDRVQLERELGDLTTPEPPLPTAMPASIPAELRPAP
jgi:hypothetical protein